MRGAWCVKWNGGMAEWRLPPIWQSGFMAANPLNKSRTTDDAGLHTPGELPPGYSTDWFTHHGAIP
jgi:hypothetical protein